MSIREFIVKLQALPENRKMIILWTIVGILVVGMGYFWVRGAINSLQKMSESVSQIKLPEIQTPVTTPTDQTADWKTYTNNDYGFEIKYPNTISLAKPVSSDTNLGLLTLPFEDKFSMYPIWLYIAKSTDNILDNIDAVNESSDIKKTKETINGIEWNKIEADAAPVNGQGTAQSVTTFYAQKADKNYFLRCIDCNVDMFGDEAKDLNNNFNQMLSTFKFVTVK